MIMANTYRMRRNAVSRLQAVMLLLLRAHRPMAAKAIASELEVSPNTARRDIEALRNMGFNTRVEIDGLAGKGFTLNRCNCPFCGSQLNKN